MFQIWAKPGVPLSSQIKITSSQIHLTIAFDVTDNEISLHVVASLYYAYKNQN